MKLNDLQKKLVMIIGILVVVVAGFMLFAMLTGGSGKVSFERAEEKMVSAAKKYYEENEALLPGEVGNKKAVTADTLSTEGYIKPLSELVNSEEACTGSVVVTKGDETFDYTAKLNCGKEYKTLFLGEAVKEQLDSTVSGKDGLYEINGEFVFRGELTNNYLEFDKKTFRIIKIDKDGSVKLISETGLSDRSVWDNRFNGDLNSKVGINNYEVSRIKNTLDESYKKSGFISKSNKAKLESKTICVGEVSEETETNKLTTEECKNTLEKQYLSLPSVSDILLASLDEGCTSPSERICQNYNYFSKLDVEYLTLTPSSINSSKIYYGSNGVPYIANASSMYDVLPVIYLSGETALKSGDGSEENPYIIK